MPDSKPPRPLRDPVIKSINIRLTPKHYPNSDNASAHVDVFFEIHTDRGRQQSRIQLWPTDFECRLDQYFDAAKEQIRKTVKDWNPEQ